ncbi:MAG TPA: hypothetical protein VHE30_25910 [Polyangiaceae bacterium]|nr:hypothetical protein [Polyangiaceae bacterium]
MVDGKTFGDLTGVTAGPTARTLEAQREERGIKSNGPVSPEHMELLRRLANDLETAAIFNLPELWERVQAAHDAWNGLTDATGNRRKGVVRAVENILEKWRLSAEWAQAEPGRDARFADVADLYVRWLANSLAHIEPAFAAVQVATARELLARAHAAASSGKTAGGRGHIGATGIAAELAVACEAFGDTDVAQSAKAFREALRK